VSEDVRYIVTYFLFFWCIVCILVISFVNNFYLESVSVMQCAITTSGDYLLLTLVLNSKPELILRPN